MDRRPIGPDLGVVLAERPGCDYWVAIERWEPAVNGTWTYEEYSWFLYPTAKFTQVEALRAASDEFERRVKALEFL